MSTTGYIMYTVLAKSLHNRTMFYEWVHAEYIVYEDARDGYV